MDPLPGLGADPTVSTVGPFTHCVWDELTGELDTILEHPASAGLGVTFGTEALGPQPVETLPGAVLGDALVSDKRVRMVSFTGGLEAGFHISNRSGLKKIGMELGSNSPVIVWKDADLAWAAETCVSGAFWAAGQNCIGVQRIYIHRDVYARFRDDFVARTKAYRIGDKMDEAVNMGPMITEAEAIPRSHKVVATATDHHGHTAGSIVVVREATTAPVNVGRRGSRDGAGAPVDGADASHVVAVEERLYRLDIVEGNGFQAARPVQHLDKQPLRLQHLPQGSSRAR